MAVEGVTITSDRRVAMRTIGALTRVSGLRDGCRSSHSLSVRKSNGFPSRVQRSLPGVRKLRLFSATRRRCVGFTISRRTSQAGSIRRNAPMMRTSYQDPVRARYWYSSTLKRPAPPTVPPAASTKTVVETFVSLISWVAGR